MATEDFPIPPEHFILGVLTFFAAAVGLGGLAFLIAWLWRLPGQLPSRLSRLEAKHAQLLEAARREASRHEHAAGKARGDLEAVQAALAKERLKQAELQAALAEARQQGSSLEAKALTAVQEAKAQEAAKAAEAQALQRELQAARQANVKLTESGRQAVSMIEDLQARHNGALQDLAVLRDCPHQESTTVYSRETDPATGSRPYRAQGTMCKRCHYVMAERNGGAALPMEANIGSQPH